MITRFQERSQVGFIVKKIFDTGVNSQKNNNDHQFIDKLNIFQIFDKCESCPLFFRKFFNQQKGKNHVHRSHLKKCFHSRQIDRANRFTAKHGIRTQHCDENIAQNNRHNNPQFYIIEQSERNESSGNENFIGERI